uniref:Uncharacterized protein n=1 Tax=Heterorhabditis bacteriophora TaxID=37862 RepID=A0A1I7XNZ2_HETBA
MKHILQLLGSWQNYHSGEVLPGNQQNAPRTTTFESSTGQSKRTNSSLCRCPIACLANDCRNLSPTDYHFFKYPDKFLQEKVFNNQAAAKTPSKNSSIPGFKNSMLLE